MACIAPNENTGKATANAARREQDQASGEGSQKGSDSDLITEGQSHRQGKPVRGR